MDERETADSVRRAVQDHLDRAYPDAERPRVYGDVRREDDWWIVPVVYSREGEDLMGYFGRLAAISIDVRKETGAWIEIAPIPLPTAA